MDGLARLYPPLNACTTTRKKKAFDGVRISKTNYGRCFRCMTQGQGCWWPTESLYPSACLASDSPGKWKANGQSEGHAEYPRQSICHCSSRSLARKLNHLDASQLPIAREPWSPGKNRYDRSRMVISITLSALPALEPLLFQDYPGGSMKKHSMS